MQYHLSVQGTNRDVKLGPPSIPVHAHGPGHCPDDVPVCCCGMPDSLLGFLVHYTSGYRYSLSLPCVAMYCLFSHFGSGQPQRTAHGGAQELSRSEEKRKEVGRSLAAVGAALEKAFKGPQDVEGALAGSQVYIVQTRPQP